MRYAAPSHVGRPELTPLDALARATERSHLSEQHHDRPPFWVLRQVHERRIIYGRRRNEAENSEPWRIRNGKARGIRRRCCLWYAAPTSRGDGLCKARAHIENLQSSRESGEQPTLALRFPDLARSSEFTARAEGNRGEQREIGLVELG
jgi:hypothetical protein